MDTEGPPHTAHTTTLPRQIRGRIDQTTDPIPEGKRLDADPK
jgi:hypothetical protein